MTVSTDLPVASHSIGRFVFEDGTVVEDAGFSYALVHPGNPPAGLVIVCPSLTGTPESLQYWWNDVGSALALRNYLTLCPHAFTAATIAARGDSAAPTIRELARGIVALVNVLGLPQATFVTGGSLGGMLALEVGIESGAPTHALVIAAPAVQTAWSEGWNRIQLRALELGGPEDGLALARAVGMMTYRTEQEFETRFGSDVRRTGGRTMRGYLDHHGQRLVERVDAEDYARRVRAMDTHDAGRDRGGWRAALAPHADRLTAVGIVGDTLYSADIVQAWAAGVGAGFASMTSVHGHDAFLLERPQMRAIIAAAFARAVVAQPVASVAH
jgi:homoserine O-acetyltransferase/O-succinyltransferase